MKDEKNIDVNVREKLEDFQVAPPPHIWDNVQGRLAAARHKKRMVYMGWISAAAVVVLAFMAGWYFNENNDVENNVATTNEIIQTEKSSGEPAEKPSENLVAGGFKESSLSDKDKSAVTVQYAVASVDSKASVNDLENSNQNMSSREMFSFARLESADARVVEKEQPAKELAISSKSVSEEMLSEKEQLLIAENIRSMKVEEKPDDNWKMGMFVAPGYSSYTASHSESYSQNMTYSGNSGNASVSGGFSVQYRTSKRWIVESGVYYAQSGQESNNSFNRFALKQDAENLFAPNEIPLVNNNVRVENNGLAMNSTAGIIAFASTPKGAELSGEFDASISKDANILVPDGQFSQVFEFMEIPLYFRYRVVDSKFGIELITGLNAGIIVGNNAYINNQYGLQNIGETLDISKVNLSGTLGLGVNYELGKHFSVALEPRYIYYLNSINTNPSVDFRPYRIGFYTGVTYEF
ncbi:MAG TPA: hypothetical protein VLA03_10755 [Draconibacterium sp.]|nr:hypothetical protein [Draconibacterium sp.]